MELTLAKLLVGVLVLVVLLVVAYFVLGAVARAYRPKESGKDYRWP